MGNSGSTNKHDVEKAKVITHQKMDQCKLEIKLAETKLTKDHEFRTKQLDLERSQAILHTETLAKAINTFLERGYDAEDFCMATTITYGALKEDHTADDSERIKNVMDHMIVRKQHKMSKVHTSHSYKAGYRYDNEDDDTESERKQG